MLVLWLVLIVSVSFGVHKNFTAIDRHAPHEKEVIEQRVLDTNKIENFVREFAFVYYSWSNTQESIGARTVAVSRYLTKDLRDLNVDAVKSLFKIFPVTGKLCFEFVVASHKCRMMLRESVCSLSEEIHFPLPDLLCIFSGRGLRHLPDGDLPCLLLNQKLFMQNQLNVLQKVV